MLAGLRGNPACADVFSKEDLRRYEAEMMTRLTVDLDNIKAKKITHIGRGSATNHIKSLILSTGRKGDFLEATGGGGITPVDFFPEWNDPPEALPTLGGNCVHLRGALRKLQVVSELPDTATKEQRSTAGAEATSAVFKESTDNSAAMVQMAAYFKHGDQFLAKVHDPITGQWRESDVITLDLDRAHVEASRAVFEFVVELSGEYHPEKPRDDRSRSARRESSTWQGPPSSVTLRVLLVTLSCEDDEFRR